MEDCKYRLPCGRCEKLGAPCDAPKENANKDEYMKQLFENVSVLTGTKETSIKECEHNWEPIVIIDQGGLRRRTEYRCSKCGTLKT